jgi:hypothetical protein
VLQNTLLKRTLVCLCSTEAGRTPIHSNNPQHPSLHLHLQQPPLPVTNPRIIPPHSSVLLVDPTHPLASPLRHLLISRTRTHSSSKLITQHQQQEVDLLHRLQTEEVYEKTIYTSIPLLQRLKAQSTHLIHLSRRLLLAWLLGFNNISSL